MGAYSVNRSKVHIAYDASYEKESEAFLVGVFMLAIPVMFITFSMPNFAKYANYGYSTLIVQVLSIGALVFRVIATWWISRIAAEQNREVGKWRVMSFFLPAISLIIIGQTKKIAATSAIAEDHSYHSEESIPKLDKTAENRGLQVVS